MSGRSPGANGVGKPNVDGYAVGGDDVLAAERRTQQHRSHRRRNAMPLTSEALESMLWQAADILRGQIDSADYKNYIFSMLFLKRLSDRFDEEVANAVAAGVPQAAAVSDPDEHQFAVPETAHWPMSPRRR